MKTVADYLKALDEDEEHLARTLPSVFVQLVQDDKTVVDVTPWAGMDVERAADVTQLPVYRLERPGGPDVATAVGAKIDRVSIGRSRGADVTVNLERLSKVHAHARAVGAGGALQIEDAGSKNGTYVGAERLAPGKPMTVKDGGGLHLGPYPFRWFTPQGFIAWLKRVRGDEGPTVTNTNQQARLEILGALGRGGMADVALARRVGPGGFAKEVALKRLLPEMVHDKNFVDMFLQEARIAARINHQNVVQIFDLGWDGSRYFIAMEYVPGWNLAVIERGARRAGKDVPLPVACRIAADLCAGLKAAHTSTDEQGRPLRIIHRDVSPQNVLVNLDGVAKLSDFGVSRAADSARRTKTGELKGKLAYMAPEQLQDGLGEIDHRTDIWSAAVTIFEIFIGIPLFRRGNDVDTMHALLNDPILDLRDVRKEVPERFALAVRRALERDPSQRTAEIAKLADELAAVCVEIGATAQHVVAFLEELQAQRVMPHVGLKPPEDAKTEVVDRSPRRR